MLNTIQCHQPLRVGASGSYTVTPKLLVPAGAFFQASDGETLAPSQPKPLYNCAAAIVAPGLTSALSSVNVPAASAASGSETRASATKLFIMFSSTKPHVPAPAADGSYPRAAVAAIVRPKARILAPGGPSQTARFSPCQTYPKSPPWRRCSILPKRPLSECLST